MAVQPQVQLFFPCADARSDVTNNSITIVDPIRTLYLPKDVFFPLVTGVPLIGIGFVTDSTTLRSKRNPP